MKRLFANKKFSLHTWVAAAALTGGIIGSPANAIDLFIDHRGAVNSASFSPDGKRLVTASDDGTARVWDAGTGKPVGEPTRTVKGNYCGDSTGSRGGAFAFRVGSKVWTFQLNFGQDRGNAKMIRFNINKLKVGDEFIIKYDSEYDSESDPPFIEVIKGTGKRKTINACKVE